MKTRRRKRSVWDEHSRRVDKHQSDSVWWWWWGSCKHQKRIPKRGAGSRTLCVVINSTLLTSIIKNYSPSFYYLLFG